MRTMPCPYCNRCNTRESDDPIWYCEDCGREFRKPKEDDDMEKEMENRYCHCGIVLKGLTMASDNLFDAEYNDTVAQLLTDEELAMLHQYAQDVSMMRKNAEERLGKIISDSTGRS